MAKKMSERVKDVKKKFENTISPKPDITKKDIKLIEKIKEEIASHLVPKRILDQGSYYKGLPAVAALSRETKAVTPLINQLRELGDGTTRESLRKD